MLKKVLVLLAVLLLFPIVAYAVGNEDVSIDTPKEYRKIKRPFPPTARAHPVAHPAPPGTTTRRASTREAAWAWQAVRSSPRRAASEGREDWCKRLGLSATA